MNEDIKPSRAARHARIIRARFDLDGRASGELLIKNVSEGGIGARCDCAHMRVGDGVRVDLPVIGQVAGWVRWCHDGQCGIAVAIPLDVARLRFRPDATLMSSPPRFSVADRFQPSTKTYRPGFRAI